MGTACSCVCMHTCARGHLYACLWCMCACVRAWVGDRVAMMLLGPAKHAAVVTDLCVHACVCACVRVLGVCMYAWLRTSMTPSRRASVGTRQSRKTRPVYIFVCMAWRGKRDVARCSMEWRTCEYGKWERASVCACMRACVRTRPNVAVCSPRPKLRPVTVIEYITVLGKLNG